MYSFINKLIRTSNRGPHNYPQTTGGTCAGPRGGGVYKDPFGVPARSGIIPEGIFFAV